MKQNDIKINFLKALHGMNKIRVVFHSIEDARRLVRDCAPMDFGPSRRAKDKSPRYHLWDYSSDVRSHTLSLLQNQVLSIEIIEESFFPEEFVTWKPNWIVARDWGKYS